MTQKANLCKALLNGEVLSILTGFKRFLVTNVPREVSRQIEQVFNVKLERTQKDFKTKDGNSGYYFEYRLLFTPYNAAGIEKMKQYVSEEEGKLYNSPPKKGPKIINATEPKQEIKSTLLKQVSLF